MGSTRTQVYLFKRYLWLYDKIASYGPISFEQLSEMWQHSSLGEGCPLPHKTFENHRRAVENLFDIDILCNRSDNTYYISQPDSPDSSQRMRTLFNSAVTLQDAMARSHNLARYIELEPIIGNISYLQLILQALDESRSLNMTYRHNYDLDAEEKLTVNPIGLKLFRQRWYLISELPDGTPYSYPLDRIISLQPGNKSEQPKINLNDLFSDCYGIIREPGVNPQSITLRVEKSQANYFLALPLHHSQSVTKVENGYVYLRLFVCPTYDFFMELLSHGEKVEIISPASVRETITQRVRLLSQLYL